MKKDKSVIIVVGPTASGKTGFSQQLAKKQSIEVINGDMGQLYTALTVGTAKPDWQSEAFPCHLFDVLDAPVDMTAFEYRKRVLKLVQEIQERGNTPVIVGGCHFYIKSLFFPPLSDALDFVGETSEDLYPDLSKQELWDKLNDIDPKRAQKIHPNDSYRVHRALTIWHKTGKKPSEFVPEFKPAFDTHIYVLRPERAELRKDIYRRTIQMIEQEGWIDEARRLIGTPWEDFVVRKGLIGYKELFIWIKNGENSSELPGVIKQIQIATAQYAKRQVTFIRSFLESLEGQNGHEFTNTTTLLN